MHINKAVIAALLAIATEPAFAGGDREELCRLTAFREAFLEGQQGLLIDDTSPSQRLIAFGDEAIPCLAGIAEHGGALFSITGCLETTDDCRVWAARALRRLATPRARSVLKAFASDERNPRLRFLGLNALAGLRDPSCRRIFLHAMEAESASERAEALVGLSVLGEKTDGPFIAAVFSGLPDEALYRALHGVRLHGDSGLQKDIEARIETVKDAEIRAFLKQQVTEWKQASEAELARIAKITNTQDPELLFLILHEVRRPTESIAAAAEPLLVHGDARVRAGAVALLARADGAHVALAQLLSVTEALPDNLVQIAAADLVHHREPIVFERLWARAGRMKNAMRKTELEQMLRRYDKAAPPR